jgi:phage tail-like protein
MSSSRNFDHHFNGRFTVEIDGIALATFSACDGLEARIDVVDFTDGSDTLARKRPGRARYANIVLRRGLTKNNELWNWFQSVANGIVVRRAGSIIVLDDAGSEAYRYNFYEGWPCRWKSLVLDAHKPGALVEEVEIAVEKIERA